MSRILFVVPPLVGHINPALSVAASLRARGHRIAWAGERGLMAAMAGEDALVFSSTVLREFVTQSGDRPAALRGPAAIKFLWESYLIPLAEAMSGCVHSALAAFEPDLVVVDQQAVAGAICAHHGNLPWATLATTSAEFSAASQGSAHVDEWVGGLIAALEQGMGYPVSGEDPRFSPHAIIVFSTEALAGPCDFPGRPISFVGPATSGRPQADDFPWEWLDERKKVLVSLGTANAGIGTRFLHECREALAARSDRLQAIIVDPDGDSGSPGLRTPDLAVLPHVPQLALLAHMDAVICHGGHNTVCEALSHGVPLVVAPIRDDQPIIADQVERSGAGIRLRFTLARARHIGDAIDSVMEISTYGEAAHAIADSFAAAGGANTAADRIEALLIATIPRDRKEQEARV